MTQHAADPHQLSDPVHKGFHVLLVHTVVLQGKGHVLCHRQADELAVRVLQDRAHHFGQVKQAQIFRVPAANGEGSRGFPRVGIGDQAVDAMGQGRLAAARRAADQDLLPLADIQGDVIQGRLRLGGVLKAEMVKGYDRLQGWTLLSWIDAVKDASAVFWNILCGTGG